MSKFDSIRFQASRPLLKEVSADRLNAILSEIKKNRPRGERGITVRQAGEATYIGLAASLKGAASPLSTGPWDLLIEADPDADPENENPPYIVRVYPGTLNGFLADNWDIETTLQSDGQLYYAKAIVQTDGQNITSVSIAIDDEPPVAQTPEKYAIQEEVEVLFGLFCDGVTYRTIAEGAINLLPEQWIITSAEPPAQPGESPYDIYYRLQ